VAIGLNIGVHLLRIVVMHKVQSVGFIRELAEQAQSNNHGDESWQVIPQENQSGGAQEKKRPVNGDDTPGRLVRDDGIDKQDADPVDRQVTQRRISAKQISQAKY